MIFQLERTKTDSILDLGLSKFEHREKFRKFAEKNEIEVKLYYLDVSKTTRMKRVLQRNKEKGVTFEFEVGKENFEFMEAWFERPSDKELKNGILINEQSLI